MVVNCETPYVGENYPNSLPAVQSAHPPACLPACISAFVAVQYMKIVLQAATLRKIKEKKETG